MKIDSLIVGQGLAGTVLAWHLLGRGERILVVDRDEPDTSSKVAAGLVTPLAGARFNLPDGLENRLDYARAFYWKHEEQSGETFFQHRRIARLFQNENEKAAWENRLATESERYTRFHEPLMINHSLFPAPHGGFEMKEGGWLDVPAFLEYTRQSLLERAAYAIGRVNADDVVLEGPGVRWKNVTAAKVIFCEGWRGNQNRFFDWIPMNGALGDILDLEIPDLAAESRILNSGGWLIPVGGGRFRAGSNYRHRFDSVSPDEGGKAEVLAKLGKITPAEPRVIGHRAAVRPVIRRSQVYLGRHPAHRQVAFFNGLGSKGVLNGPWYAAQLVGHLLDDTDLPAESDIAGNHF